VPTRTVLVNLLALGALVIVHATRAGDHPPVTVPQSELRTLQSTATGRSYDLYVRTPADYGKKEDTRYPVLYLLDGQWDFKLLDSVVGGLVYDRWMPDIIVIGITYSGEHADYDALRAMDYTPVPGKAPGSGGGARFLKFLHTELIPFVESNYRTDPARRILAGHSLGGLFTLYAMFEDPSGFWGYLAGSPAFDWQTGYLPAREEQYASTHPRLPARLFIAVGGAEPTVTPAVNFVKTLSSRKYLDFEWDGRVIEGERHAGVKPEFYNRALRFMFANP
jgi:uncharacterized protein